MFPGRLEKKRLSFGERAIVLALRAPEGDFPDWDDNQRGPLGIAAGLG